MRNSTARNYLRRVRTRAVGRRPETGRSLVGEPASNTHATVDTPATARLPRRMRKVRAARRGTEAEVSAVAAVLDVVDRAYDVESTDEAWVRGITGASLPLVDSGMGVHGFRFDLATGLVGDPALAGGSDEWASRWREVWWEGFMLRLPPSALRTMAEFGPISHTTDLWAATAKQIPTFEEMLTQRGRGSFESVGAVSTGMQYPDSLNVVAVDASGIGVALCANREQVASAPPDARARWILARVVGHIAAAARLRARLGRSRLLDQADAVLAPHGAVLHAEPSTQARVTREALRAAARDVTSARNKRATDPEDVVGTWRALYAGEFSVVDVFDSDGRRFVVAKSNAPTPPAPVRPSAMSKREQQVMALLASGCSNKLIAYELGLTPSTVSKHVRTIARALGAGSTSELVTRARRLRDETSA